MTLNKLQNTDMFYYIDSLTKIVPKCNMDPPIIDLQLGLMVTV